MKKKPILLYAVSVLIVLVHILPFYVLVTTAFKAPDDLSSKWMFPGYWYSGNFAGAWKEAYLGKVILNNVFITSVSVLFVVIVGALASYPLSRYKTTWNKAAFMLLISSLIVPPLTILVPLYKFFVDLHALNTFWGIITLHVTFYLPVTIFLYTGFIGSIPAELDEAAMIDGSSKAGLFFRIILPLLKPITATVIIYTGVHVWNDFSFSIFFLQREEVHTITVSLSKFFGENSNNVGWVAAGALIGALPMISMYMFLQKYFIQGLSSGALKG